jgi:hypothetical protein
LPSDVIREWPEWGFGSSLHIETTWDPVAKSINPQDITYSVVAAKLVDSIWMDVEDVWAKTGVYVRLK